jgi:hypothetical protein
MRVESTYTTLSGDEVIAEGTSSQDRESRMSQNKKHYNIPPPTTATNKKPVTTKKSHITSNAINSAVADDYRM